jgi:hypothetical protein
MKNGFIVIRRSAITPRISNPVDSGVHFLDRIRTMTSHHERLQIAAKNKCGPQMQPALPLAKT